VQTLSTVPVTSAATSSYNAMPSVGLVNAPSSMDDSVLKTPSPRLLGLSKTARITGQLVDCGLGKATCEGVCEHRSVTCGRMQGACSWLLVSSQLLMRSYIYVLH
jgi:hypothetical protein